MSRHMPKPPVPIGDVLWNAVAAADAAAQTATGIWSHMTPQQQDKWLAERRSYWPRHDLHLAVYLNAAIRAVDVERYAESADGGSEPT